MAAYLSLVVYAAQGDAHIFAAQGFGDALAERCLAHSRRTVEAEDGCLVRFAVAQGGQVFQDAFLHLLHTIMVAVQDALGIANVQVVVGMDAPGQADNGLQVVQLHVIVRHLRIDAFELLQLAAEDGLHLFREYQPGGFLLQVGHVAVLVLTQFALNVFYLLVEEELLLLLVQFFAGLLLDFVFQLCKLALAVQQLQQFEGAPLEVVFQEQLVAFVERERHVDADEVDEENGVGDVFHGEGRLIGPLHVAQFQEAHHGIAAGIHQYGKLLVSFVVNGLFERGHLGAVVRFSALQAFEQQWAVALENGRRVAVGQVDGAHHACHHALLVQVGGGGFFHRSVFLREHGDEFTALHGLGDHLQA